MGEGREMTATKDRPKTRCNLVLISRFSLPAVTEALAYRLLF